MPICKVICNEDFRDDFYELKISEKVMFFVQLCLGITALTVTILDKDKFSTHDIIFIAAVTWNVLECIFYIGGFIVFHILYRPMVIVYLILMGIHVLMRIVYVIVLLVELKHATLHIALTTLSAILASVQLWAGFLLLRLLGNKNSHGYNHYMYIPEPNKSKFRPIQADGIWE